MSIKRCGECHWRLTNICPSIEDMGSGNSPSKNVEIYAESYDAKPCRLGIEYAKLAEKNRKLEDKVEGFYEELAGEDI